MTELDDNSDLRGRFAAERRTEGSSGPAFADMWAAARRAPAARRLKPFPRARLIAVAVLTLALAVIVVHRRGPRPEPTAAVDWQVASSLAAWRAPTDFLLEVPGREVLRVPALVPPIPRLADLQGVENR